LTILYMFYKEKQFIYRTVKPLLPLDGVIPKTQVTPSDEINTNLIAGLSEGHRLAATAYEAELASYQNRGALYSLGILPAGFILFTLVAFIQYGFTQQFLTMFPWTILYAFLFDASLAVPIIWYIRRQSLPHLREYRAWSERLQKRLTAEVTKTSPEEDNVSTFEFLTEASQEIPKWVDTIRRKGLNLDVPGQILFIFFRIEWVGLYFITLVVPIIMMWNVFIGSLVGVIGIPLSIYYIYTYYRKWKHRLEQETTQTFTTWNEKYKDLRLKIEQYLQDL